MRLVLDNLMLKLARNAHLYNKAWKMSEQLLSEGGLTIVRACARCDRCHEVKRGTQRHSETGYVTVCESCEETCQQAMVGPAPPTSDRTPGAGIEEISSRQVSEWLEHLCNILEGEVAKLEVLGLRAFEDNFNWLGDCRRVAQWLWDGKFQIRDSWRLRVAVNGFLKQWDWGLPKDQPAIHDGVEMLRAAFEPFKGDL